MLIRCIWNSARVQWDDAENSDPLFIIYDQLPGEELNQGTNFKNYKYLNGRGASRGSRLGYRFFSLALPHIYQLTHNLLITLVSQLSHREGYITSSPLLIWSVCYGENKQTNEFYKMISFSLQIQILNG